MIANLGDSRAVLCTRGIKDILVPVQLTVDLKPNLPSEFFSLSVFLVIILPMGEGGCIEFNYLYSFSYFAISWYVVIIRRGRKDKEL